MDKQQAAPARDGAGHDHISRLPSLRLSLAPIQMGLLEPDADDMAALPALPSLSNPSATSPLSPSMARPPTPGGGPLSSHPASPLPYSDRCTPPSSARSTDHFQKPAMMGRPATIRRQSVPLGSVHIHQDEQPRRASAHLLRTSDFRTDVPARKPLAPASSNISKKTHNPLKRSNSTGVKKLLGLGGALRSSFSSSHTSLVRPNTPSTPSTPPSKYGLSSSSNRRPSSPPSLVSPTRSTADSQHSYSATVSSMGPATPRLRKRKSNGWFRRSSFFLNLNNDEDEYGMQETKNYTTIRGSIVHLGPNASPRTSDAPTLPELSPPTHKTWAEGLFASLQR